MYDVRPDQYPSVSQGFIPNAYVSVKTGETVTTLSLSLVGILVALSAFVMLYRSYQARGYLQFLGLPAKAGTLREEDLPLVDCPGNIGLDF